MNHPPDAGELLALSDARAAQVPADISGLTRPELEVAAAHLDAANAAIEQLLALVPPGAHAVPLSACWTMRSLEVYGDDPTRYHQAELLARRDALKKVRYAITRRRGELADPAFHERNRALMDTLMTGLKTGRAPG